MSKSNPFDPSTLIGRPMELADARVGSVVWWTCPAGVEVQPGAIKRRILSHKDDFAEPTTAKELADCIRDAPKEPEHAMRAAIRRRQSSRATRNATTFWREQTERETPEAMFVVHAVEDLSGTYEAHESFAVEVDKKTGRTKVHGTPGSKEAKKALTKLLERYRKEAGLLTATDVTGALARMLTGKLGALKVKHGGAVYFLRKDLDIDLAWLAVAFAESKCGVLLRFEEVASRTAGMYADDASEGLLELAAKLKASCEERMAAADDYATGKRKSQPDGESMNARFDAIDDLRSEARFLKKLLGAATEDVEAALRDTELLMKKALVRARLAPKSILD